MRVIGELSTDLAGMASEAEPVGMLPAFSRSCSRWTRVICIGMSDCRTCFAGKTGHG